MQAQGQQQHEWHKPGGGGEHHGSKAGDPLLFMGSLVGVRTSMSWGAGLQAEGRPTQDVQRTHGHAGGHLGRGDSSA